MESRTPNRSPIRTVHHHEDVHFHHHASGSPLGKRSPPPIPPAAAVPLAVAVVTTASASASPQNRPLYLLPPEPAAGEAELERAIAHQNLAREYLPRLFHNDPTLTSLELSGTACSDVALIALTDALKLNMHIKTLHLDGNDITDEGARLLGDAIAVNMSLTVLSLRCNSIGTRGAQFLISALELNDQLVECDTSSNEYIDDESLKELTILTRLNAKPRSLKKVVLDLKRGTAGSILDLSRSETARAEFRELAHNEREHLDDWAAETLGFYLSSNQSVTHVDLSFHHIGDEGAFHLSEMLKKNRYVDKLNLQGNMVSSVGAGYFIDALRINNSCRYICLLKNSAVSDQNIIRLEWASVLNRQPLALKPLVVRMENNDPTLTDVHLDVSESQRYFDDMTARLVSDALRRNSIVEVLRITNSRVSQVGCRFIGDLLCMPGLQLRLLDLSYNPLGDAGCGQIAAALVQNSSVMTLKLRHIDLGDAGAASLAELLRQNETLTELDVSSNMRLTKIGGAQLVAALNGNNVLVELNVADTDVGLGVTDDIDDRQKLNSEPPRVRQTINQLYSVSSPTKAVRLCGKTETRRLQDASMKLVAEGIEANFTATTIDVSHNHLTIVGIANLMMALFENKNTAIELDISYNRVSDPLELGRMIARLLQTHQTLKRLNLSGMHLNDAAVNRIAQVLDTEQSFPIQSILIDDNPDVSDDAAFNLIALVKMNTLQLRLKDVLRPFWTRWKLCVEDKRDFPMSHISFKRYNPVVNDPDAPQNESDRIDYGAKLVCDVLRRIEGVTSLDYSENELGDAGAAHFAQLLTDKSPSNKCRLVSLNLSKNRIGDTGVGKLKTAAECSLQLLELSVDGSAEVISKSLLDGLQRAVLYNRQPPLLQEMLVRISNDDPAFHELHLTTTLGESTSTSSEEDALVLGDNQVMLISEGLQRNTVMTVINLSHCHVTWKSVGMLLDVILTNMTQRTMCRLERLVLRNLMLSESDSEPLCRAIGAILMENQKLCDARDIPSRPLLYVDIGCNVIASSDIHHILAGLTAHKSLEAFGVNNCGLSETEMLRIQLSVAKNKPLQGEVRDVVALAGKYDPSVTEIISTRRELNSISSVDVCEALTASALLSRSFIVYLDISENELSDGATANCFTALAQNNVIRDLRMCRNHVGSSTIQSLISFLKVNVSLQYLDLRQNLEITLDSLQQLKNEAIHSNDTIRQIFISDEEELRTFNELRRKQLEGIISTLPPLLPLTRRRPTSTASSVATSAPRPSQPIGAMSTTTEDDDWAQDATAPVPSSQSTELQKMRRYFLEELTLNQQLFIKHLLPHIHANDPTVTCVQRPPRAHSKRLSSVDTPGGIVPSIMMSSGSEGNPLQQQTSYTGLHNDIGCEHIAEALLYNTHITELDLSCGLITDRGCVAIARSLMVNRSLTSLTLSQNAIGDEGVMMLANVLQVNPFIRSVDVSQSRIPMTPISLDQLRFVLTQNDTVRSISVAPQPKPTSAGSMHTGRSSIVSRTTSALSSQSRAQANKDMAMAQSRLALVSALNSIHLNLKEFLRHDSDGHLAREIDCSNANLQGGRKFDREACRILCSALANDQYITQLNLSDNNLDNECAQMIATLLETNVGITTIDLSGNPRISDGANVLHDALIKNHSVVSMKLSRCSCASLILEKVQLLLNLNREHIAMKYEILELQKRKEAHTTCRINVAELFPVDVVGYPGIANRKHQLDDASMDIISQVLRADVIVTTLDFSWNSIGDSGFHTLLLLLKRNKGLTSLQLSRNLVTDDAIKQLGYVVSQIPSLAFLDVSYNQLTAESVPVLIQILRKAPALHRVLLEGNRIGPRERDTVSFYGLLNEKCTVELRGMLTSVIDNSPTMRELDMNSFYSCGNWLPDGTTMQLLCFALLSNTMVTSLELEFNDIDNKQFHALCHLLQTNRTIKKLNLANNLIDDVQYFVERDGFQLTHLVLRKNRLGKPAAMALSQFLRSNTTLESLDISNNVWGRAGASIITESLSMNVRLSELEMGGEGIPPELEEKAKYALTLNYRSVVLRPTS